VVKMDKSTKQHLEEWRRYKDALEFQIKAEHDEEIKDYYRFRLGSVNYLIAKYDD